MAPSTQKLAAFLVCSFARAVADTPEPAVQPDDHADNGVSLLQASFKIQASLASQALQNKPVPTFIVDLDVAPELRWRNVTPHYKKLGVFPAACYAAPFPKSLSTEMMLMRAVEADDEYKREMNGIVSDIGLPPRYVDILLMVALGYELSGSPLARAINSVNSVNSSLPPRGCSGLLAAMPNGTVVHGRDMDWYGVFPTNDGGTLYMPDVTIEVLFMRGGKPLYTSVHWPGQTGVHTAMRFGGWSFENNLRHSSWRSNFKYGMTQGSQGYQLSVRKIMETTPDFETAVMRLSGLNLVSPIYFIVAGTVPYQGAVITKDPGSVQRRSTPLLTRLSSGLNMVRHGQNYTDWNIIQTNDDLNMPPLDYRRPKEEFRLAQSVQAQVSPSWVWNQMTSPALYNDLTVFTSVYVPTTGYHLTLAHPESRVRAP